MFEISRVDPCPAFFACGNLGVRGKLAQSLASAESRNRRLNEFSEKAGENHMMETSILHLIYGREVIPLLAPLFRTKYLEKFPPPVSRAMRLCAKK